MGISKHPVFRRYTLIRQAIYNPNSPDYQRIGAKGVKLYWDNSHDFCQYVEKTIGMPPNGTYSKLTRIDLNDDFRPGNLKWATSQEVGNRQCDCVYLTYKRTTKTCSEWSRITGINYFTIRTRIMRGWTIAQALGYKARKK